LAPSIGRWGHLVEHMQLGFPLHAAVEALSGDTTLIRLTLSDGQTMLIDGPPIPADHIGTLQVMYYPGQCLEILLVDQPGHMKRMRIPIDDLPPHRVP
jgi:hypothetical protein